MCEKDEGDGRYLSVASDELRVRATLGSTMDLSSSLKLSALNAVSHPTSIRILVPPSNSSSDCTAGDSDCAPSKGVKVNISIICAFCSSWGGVGAVGIWHRSQRGRGVRCKEWATVAFGEN